MTPPKMGWDVSSWRRVRRLAASGGPPPKITTPSLPEFLVCAGGLVGYGLISGSALVDLWPWPQWYRNVGFWLFLCVVQYFGYRMVVWWQDLAWRWQYHHPKAP